MTRGRHEPLRNARQRRRRAIFLGRRAANSRYGGEEFALLLKDTDPARMRSIAQRICDAIRDGAIEHRNRHDGISVVTVSIGVAIASTGVGTASLAAAATELVETADRALYAAKNAGRNRVQFAFDDT